MSKAFLSDMDGVIYRGNQLIPGATIFIQKLLQAGNPFLFLTNASEHEPSGLLKKLINMGISGLNDNHFMTSSMTAAAFLSKQSPNAKVFVIGEAGLRNELSNSGLILTNENPDYVVVGKTRDFDFKMLSRAVSLIRSGARFIGANPDLLDPVEAGVEPACGSILAAIEAASGMKPYIVGKPNALMMLYARKKLGVHSSETVMIGDRMDTDILGGTEAGMTTCLVLTGVSKRDDLKRFPYQPDYIFNHIGEIEPEKF